jgi:hypothetical protein
MLKHEFEAEVSETDDVFGLAGDSMSKVRLIFKVEKEQGKKEGGN